MQNLCETLHIELLHILLYLLKSSTPGALKMKKIIFRHLKEHKDYPKEYACLYKK